MMDPISQDEALRVLADLIRFPTVNPMGKPCTSSEPVERRAIEYVAEIFRPYGVEIIQQRCDPRHENLLIKIPGKVKEPFTLLESHVDTVPADDWPQRAFTPIVKGSLIFGRGACDDKGPLAAMILAVRAILESGQLPSYPVALLAAGDEEYSQTGIKSFVRLGYPLIRSVIGEPTNLVPILQHKGTVRWDIIVHGRSAHSSRPELGRNAITGAMHVLKAIEQTQERLQAKFHNPWMTGPTLTVTMINGGRTRNAIADECSMAIDFRVLPGMDPTEARQALIGSLFSDSVEISHGDIQLTTPPLNTQPDNPFSQSVLDICRKVTGNKSMAFAGAPYGTDAAWVANSAPALVLGPGTIESAHAIDENVDICEVVRCAQIYREIVVSEI
jgi:acetylornithine deacetylase